jgi:hypothetical protein
VVTDHPEPPTQPPLYRWIENLLAALEPWRRRIRTAWRKAHALAVKNAESAGDHATIRRLEAAMTADSVLRDDEDGRAIRKHVVDTLWPLMQDDGTEAQVVDLINGIASAAERARTDHVAAEAERQRLIRSVRSVADMDRLRADYEAAEHRAHEALELELLGQQLVDAVKPSSEFEPRAFWINFAVRATALLDSPIGQHVIRRMEEQRTKASATAAVATIEQMQKAVTAAIEPVKQGLNKLHAAVATTPASAAQRASESGPEAPCNHSEDYSSVRWFGATYTFTKTQARCIQKMWEEYEKGTSGLSEETLGVAAGSSAARFRLREVFRNKKSGMHPAWGTMIISLGKGVFGLARKNRQ